MLEHFIEFMLPEIVSILEIIGIVVITIGSIVDVRTQQEYKEKHIPDAVLVPNETIEEEAKDKLPDTDAVLLVHCRTGVRSKQASDKLVQMGYKNVYDFGGINDWPYDTVSE